jgi:septum formation protein
MTLKHDYKTISKDYPLVLASSSPRRKRLLEQIGLPHVRIVSDVEEQIAPDLTRSSDRPGGECNAQAESSIALARLKALAVFERSGDAWVLGADTMVVLGNTILGKPGDKEESRSMLQLLSGREHHVVTGFQILYPSGESAHSEAVTTRVRVKGLSSDEIDAYIRTGEPFGKAGSYAIQGKGAFMIESIRGSYTNVVGLPICELIKALLRVQALENFPFQ